MTTINETKAVEEVEDEDELDGWGPIRARRSSIPAHPQATASSEGRSEAVQAAGVTGAGHRPRSYKAVLS